jgi:RimJ/RimL family protein N-acetyltransferase
MINGKLISLRAIEEEDLPILRDYRNELNIRKMCREVKLLNMIRQMKWFEEVSYDPHNIMFAIINKKNKLIGACGITNISWTNRTCEISFYIGDRDNWQESKEIKETITLLCDYAFKELNLNRIWAETYSNTLENAKLLEELGFVEEGVCRETYYFNGKYYDSIFHGLLKKEYLRLTELGRILKEAFYEKKE